jgi:uncharacterized protein YggE
MKPMKRIHNTETNEIIDREMNDAEFEQYQADQAAEVIRQAKIEATAKAKAQAEAKLTKLGLTIDDLRALGL